MTRFPMSRPTFLGTRLGRVSLISILATLAMNLVVVSQAQAWYAPAARCMPAIAAPASTTVAAITGELA